MKTSFKTQLQWVLSRKEVYPWNLEQGNYSASKISLLRNISQLILEILEYDILVYSNYARTKYSKFKSNVKGTKLCVGI